MRSILPKTGVKAARHLLVIHCNPACYPLVGCACTRVFIDRAQSGLWVVKCVRSASIINMFMLINSYDSGANVQRKSMNPTKSDLVLYGAREHWWITISVGHAAEDVTSSSFMLGFQS